MNSPVQAIVATVSGEVPDMEFFDHLPLATVLADRSLTLLRINPRGRQLFALPEPNPGPDSLTDLCGRQAVKILGSLIDQTATDQSVLNATLPCQLNGQEMEIRTWISLLDDDKILLQFQEPESNLSCLAGCQHYQILHQQYEHNPAGILLVDEEMAMISFNRQFLRMWNIPDHIRECRDDNESLKTVIDQVRDPDSFLSKVYELYDHPDQCSTDEVELKDGRVFYRHSYPIHMGDRYLGRVWYFLDITELKETQRHLAREQKFQHAVLEHVRDGIIACNDQGELTMFNRASRIMHGCDMLRKPLSEWTRGLQWFHPDTGQPLDADEVPVIRAYNEKQVRNQEVVIRSRDGERRELRVNGQPMFDEQGRRMGAVVSLHDITDLNQARRELQHLAFHDPLTGLPNRRLFHDLLEQTLSRARRNHELVAVLFLDLDNFKQVNDRFGHDQGDRLLLDIADRLRAALRNSDLIARWGGDEFVIALPEMGSSETAVQVGEKICASLGDHLDREMGDCRVSSSIGIALFPDNGTQTDHLVRQADMAMYLAKKQGKNRCVLFDAAHVNELSGD